MALTLRLTEDDERVLAAPAEADGVCPQEAAIRALHEVAGQRGHERRVCEASAGARARYADVLQRLGG